MAKKRTRRKSTDNKNNKQSSKKCKSDKSSADNKKLADFSYAELVVLSATLSYSLAEELDEDDLAIFLVFLGLLIAEMQAIITQRAIKQKSQADTDEDEDLDEEDLDVDVDLD